MQETYIRLVDRSPPDPSGIRAWLFTVATNLARDDHKLSARRRRLLANHAGGLAPPAPETDTLERAEARARVRRALATLSEKERVLLLMREEGFKHREIAAAVGTTTGSVGTLVARALAKLTVHLERKPEAE